MRGVLVTSVFCLAVGLGVLVAFCHGTTGLSLAYPFSGTSVRIDMTTTGLPAIIGVGLTGLGAFLLIVATMIALAGILSRRRNEAVPTKRRETAFEE